MVSTHSDGVPINKAENGLNFYDFEARTIFVNIQIWQCCQHWSLWCVKFRRHIYFHNTVTSKTVGAQHVFFKGKSQLGTVDRSSGSPKVIRLSAIGRN